MYNTFAFIKSEIKDNYNFTEEQAAERNIKFYKIYSLFNSLLKDFYSNKYGVQYVKHFDVHVNPFNLTLKNYSVFCHIVIDFSNVVDYNLNIQVNSDGKTYIYLTKIQNKIKHEIGFEIESFNKISFDKSDELAQTFKHLIELFNK